MFVLSAVVAFGTGKAVLTLDKWIGARPHLHSSLVHFLLATRLVPAKLCLSQELHTQHPHVCSVFRDVAGRGKAWGDFE